MTGGNRRPFRLLGCLAEKLRKGINKQNRTGGSNQGVAVNLI